MEIQLQELIEQIKKDGVGVAELEAASIIESANREAQRIISEAKSKAEKITLDAKAESERFARIGEEAVCQAGRNVLISFRESVTRELNAVIENKVNEIYSSDTFSDLIVKMIEAWVKNSEAEDITLLLNSDDLTALRDTVISEIRERLSTAPTLKADDSFSGGFRIAVDDGRAYYDYSASSVVEMLSSYLSPKITALMKEAEGI